MAKPSIPLSTAPIKAQTSVTIQKATHPLLFCALEGLEFGTFKLCVLRVGEVLGVVTRGVEGRGVEGSGVETRVEILRDSHISLRD